MGFPGFRAGLGGEGVASGKEVLLHGSFEKQDAPLCYLERLNPET